MDEVWGRFTSRYVRSAEEELNTNSWPVPNLTEENTSALGQNDTNAPKAIQSEVSNLNIQTHCSKTLDPYK